MVQIAQITSVIAGNRCWPQIKQNTQSSVSKKETKFELLKHVTASPGTWPDIIQKCGIFQRTVLPRVPLLRIKAQDDSIAREKRSPHHNIPNWPFPTIIDNEVKSHPEEHEEHEEHWIEKAQAEGQGVLVHHGGHGEDGQHGGRLEPLREKPQKVLVSIVIQPVMNHHIPCPVIVGV